MPHRTASSDRDAPRNFDRDTMAPRWSRRVDAIAATLTRAGTGLLVWVTAISKYFDVAKNVGPRVA